MPGCTAHPQSPAGWHCPNCARDLCAQCAGVSENAVVVCMTCGTIPTEHLAPRAELFPFLQQWPAAVRDVLSARGVFQVVLVATVAHGCFTWGKSLWLMGGAITAIWVLNVARRASLGIGAFHMPSWADAQLVLTGSLWRFACTGAILGGAAMALTDRGLRSPPLTSGWLWLVALAALIAVPPALVMATVQGRGLAWVWPWRVVPALRALGSDLRPLHAATLIFVVLELVESQLAPANRELEDMRMLEHLFQAYVPRVVSFAALGALGSLSGLLVLTRARELGHHSTEPELLPQVAVPTARYFPPMKDLEAEEAARVKKYKPITFDAEPAPTAIDRGAKDEALTAYRLGEIRAAALALGPAITLAQWLSGDGDAQSAANLLRVVTGSAAPDDPSLARAMVVLARLCGERLDMPAEAARLYAEVAQRFPGTAAAKFAAAQLALQK